MESDVRKPEEGQPVLHESSHELKLDTITEVTASVGFTISTGIKYEFVRIDVGASARVHPGSQNASDVVTALKGFCKQHAVPEIKHAVELRRKVREKEGV